MESQGLAIAMDLGMDNNVRHRRSSKGPMHENAPDPLTPLVGSSNLSFPTYKFYTLPASTLGAGRQTRRGNAQEVQRTAMPISIQLDRLDLEVERDEREDETLS